MTNSIHLLQLLQRYASIEIPIIQRDYAQGRPSPRDKTKLNDKGDRFLKTLFEHLDQGTPLYMDIVYGSVECRGHQQVFLPLDGQQRLTTLWLLHWYVAQHDNTAGTEAREEVLALLSKFSYSTRRTAREFCQKLCQEQLPKGEKPSTYVSDRQWYTRGYKQDPTVQAMLLMLDCIHKLYSSTPISMDCLKSLTFRCFDIGEYGLSDDLYVKMNGRGRELSGVENLKADLIDYLKRHNYDFVQEEACDRKMDHQWADMAWGKGEKANEGFDARYLRLFNHYFYNLWIESNLSRSDDTIPSGLSSAFGQNDYRGFAPYEVLLGEASSERLQEMVDFFDFLVQTQNKEEYRVWLRSPWQTKKGPSTYPFLIDHDNPSRRERLALYAQMLYVRHAKQKADSPDHYRAWMRIVWNYIIDPQHLRNYADMVRKLKRLASLAPHVLDIEAHVKTLPDTFGPRLKHEADKLRYLDTYPTRRAALLRAELHPCLQGQIAFLLEADLKGDADFERAVHFLYHFVTGDLQKDGKTWWPALIAQSQVELPAHKIHYFAHYDKDLKVKWRYQALFNDEAFKLKSLWGKLLPQIVKAKDKAEVRNLFQQICDNYVLSETYSWHYPLVKYGLLARTEYGRLYDRIVHDQWKRCLHVQWRVTHKNGYYNLNSPNRPKVATK